MSEPSGCICVAAVVLIALIIFMIPALEAASWNAGRAPRVTHCVTTVGFIGSGRIGGTEARLAIAAGYDVVLSNSRRPQALKDLVEELGPQARAATPAGAAAAGDLVVVSIPPRAYPAVPVEPLASRPVLDTINYIPQRDERIRGLGGSLSNSVVLQRHLGTAPVVEVFSNITFWHLASLARAAGAADRRPPADRRGRPGREGGG